MKEVSKVIFVFYLTFMVMIKSRYLLIEIDREPHAIGLGLQDKSGGKFCVNWLNKVFKHTWYFIVEYTRKSFIT